MAIKTQNPKMAESAIQFGRYPQSVAPKDYVSAMKYVPNKNVYYCAYDKSDYVKIIATPYHDVFSPQCYHFSSGEPVEAGKEYFFKIEPITWMVLLAGGLTTMLLSQKIIDSKLYLEPQFVGRPRVDGYPNNYYPDVDSAFPNTWEYSTLRAWLNGTRTYHDTNNFYTSAFKKEEQKKIETVFLMNDPASSKIKHPERYSWVHQRNTKDKVYCLSVDEATSFGFSNDPKAKDSDIAEHEQDRAAEVTDYAIARGVRPYYFDQKAIGWWWLRSPGDPDEHEITTYNIRRAPICQKRACDVTEDGHICQRASIVCGEEEDSCDGSANGIRPAINVKNGAIVTK